jgi:hypothetical protein
MTKTRRDVGQVANLPYIFSEQAMANNTLRDNMIQVAFDEATAHGLVPAHIAIDAQGLGMAERRFPDPATYLRLAGPPGGPLGLRIEAYTDITPTAESLGKLVKRRYAKARDLAVGPVETLCLSGREVLAIGCSEGESMARAHHCIILFPASEGAARGVLVDFWVAAGETAPPGCQAIIGRYQTLFESLEIRFQEVG